MRRRLWLFLVSPVLALLLVVVLLYSVRSAQPVSASAAIDETADWTPAATVAADASTDAPTAAATAQPPAQPPAQDAGLLAVVNGEQLTTDRFALAQSVDRVMSGLLAAEPAQDAQLLEQMINSALVARRLAASGAAPAVDASARLDALLISAGKTQADLTAALAAADIERARFDQYFSELLTVQEFARRAAKEEGDDVGAYIAALQAAAHISYGPAAAGLDLSQAAASAAATPAAATAALAPTSTPTGTQAALAGQARTPALQGQMSTPADELRGLEIGQLAPDFALAALGEDQTQTAFADLLGQPLVLSFWTTWCPYCLRQTPVLVAGAERYTGAVRFVGVDVAEDSTAVAPYVEQHAIPYLILLDRESQAAAAYAVDGYPTTYFLDATGHIVARQIGSLSEEQLTQYVEQLLAPHP